MISSSQHRGKPVSEQVCVVRMFVIPRTASVQRSHALCGMPCSASGCKVGSVASV